MGFYERKLKRDDSLNLRIPKQLKESLARLSKAWEFLDSLEDDGPEFSSETKGNPSDVAYRLLMQSIGPAWKEIGGFEPTTDEEWEKFYSLARGRFQKGK